MQITLEEHIKFKIETSDNDIITFDTLSGNVMIGDYDVTYPGEYEKYGILLEVKEHLGELYYHFVVDGYHIAIINTEDMDLTEEMFLFFGDIDILFLKGTKKSVKIFDNIEAKAVIPYGEEKGVFFVHTNTHPEPTEKYKITKKFDGEETEFIDII